MHAYARVCVCVEGGKAGCWEIAHERSTERVRKRERERGEREREGEGGVISNAGTDREGKVFKSFRRLTEIHSIRGRAAEDNKGLGPTLSG